jgi:small conductance mechanosensitive channel
VPLPSLDPASALAWASLPDWQHTALRIVLFFGVAWLVHRAAPWLARHLVRLRYVRGRPVPERLTTLRSIVASALSFGALVVALVLTLAQFVDANTLLWVIGLFSAAFGLGARDFVNDIVAGLGIVLDDIFAVGEKIEIGGVEGVVEAVTLRMTRLRSPTGELFMVPNGEVRVVRNFSRGRFSAANVTVRVAAGDLPLSLAVLGDLAAEAVELLPDLVEPWRVISPDGHIGRETDLTLVAKARFGRAAELRPRLLALVHERLAEAGVRVGEVG